MVVTDELRAKLSKIGVATLTTSLLKRGLRNQYLPGIIPVDPTLGNMVGPAFTMRFIPAREDIDTLASLGKDDNVQRRAIENCPPGAVLVVDSREGIRSATAGDLVIGRLAKRGCAGIVTDGGFRDVAGVRKVGLPAYQRQTCSAPSPSTMHAADLDVPIGCGGVAVYPGDVVVGDCEGVVIIPAAIAHEIACDALEATVYEDFAEAMIADGQTFGDVFPPNDQSRAAFEAWRLVNDASAG